MLLAELFSQFLRCVTFVNNDALLLVGTQVDIYKKQGWVGVVKVIFLFVLLRIDDLISILCLLLPLNLLLFECLSCEFLICLGLNFSVVRLNMRKVSKNALRMSLTYVDIGLRLLLLAVFRLQQLLLVLSFLLKTDLLLILALG